MFFPVDLESAYCLANIRHVTVSTGIRDFWYGDGVPYVGHSGRLIVIEDMEQQKSKMESKMIGISSALVIIFSS